MLPPAVIGTASSLAMPAAQVSLQISNFVAQGSKRLSDRVVGAEAVTAKKPARKAAPKAAVKKRPRARPAPPAAHNRRGTRPE